MLKRLVSWVFKLHRCPECHSDEPGHVSAVRSPEGFCGNVAIYGIHEARERMKIQDAHRKEWQKRHG